NINNEISLITALYTLRHPLLYKLLNEYSVKFDGNIFAVAEQYVGKYNEAWSSWNNIENLLKENVKDIILISIILSDDTLLIRYKEIINANKSEWSNLLKLVKRELPSMNSKLGGWFEETLICISKSLI